MQQDRDQGRGTEASPLSLVSEAAASAFADARESFERFCLAAGIEAMETLLEEEATSICGHRHGRDAERAVYRWGATVSPVGFHGGKVGVRRPRLRGKRGGEVALDGFAELKRGDLLQAWAYELMLLGVATRRYGRAVRLESGDLARQSGDGTSKSAVSRRFVAPFLGRDEPSQACRLAGP